MKIISRPFNEDAPPWCPYFFNLVPEDDLLSAFRTNKKFILDLIKAVPATKEEFKYDENKWTIKELCIHLIDTERFYTYRAMCSSRQVDIDHEFSDNRDIYAKNSNASNRTLKDIAEEFSTVRDATITLFSNMTDEMLDFKGFPNKMVYTARSLGWMTVGHAIHHCNILKERYLK